LLCFESKLFWEVLEALRRAFVGGPEKGLWFGVEDVALKRRTWPVELLSKAEKLQEVEEVEEDEEIEEELECARGRRGAGWRGRDAGWRGMATGAGWTGTSLL
jgi:hypothetical protein